MTDEQLVSRLTSLREAVAGVSILSDYAFTTIDAAIERLTPAHPLSGFVEVRIAVAMGDGAESCRILNPDSDGEEEMDFVRIVCTDHCPKVLGEAIVSFRLPLVPPRVVPFVTGTVEPVA